MIIKEYVYTVEIDSKTEAFFSTFEKADTYLVKRGFSFVTGEANYIGCGKYFDANQKPAYRRIQTDPFYGIFGEPIGHQFPDYAFIGRLELDTP